MSLPVREERRGPVARYERKTRRRGESKRENKGEKRRIAKQQRDFYNSVRSSGSSVVTYRKKENAAMRNDLSLSMLVVGWLVGIPKNKFQPTRANLSLERP